MFSIHKIYDAHPRDVMGPRVGVLGGIFIVVAASVYLACGLRKLKLQVWYEAMIFMGIVTLFRALLLPGYFAVSLDDEQFGRLLFFLYCIITILAVYIARPVMLEEISQRDD